MKALLKATLAALFVATVFAVMTPTANAQATALIIETGPLNPASIEPDGAPSSFKITATYTISNAALTPVGAVSTTANVVITYSCPTDVVISGPSSILIPIQPTSSSGGTATGTYKGEASYTITATRNVPGLKGLSCQINGQVSEIGNAAALPSASSKATLQFSVKYFSLIQAKVDSKIQEAGPQKQIPYNIVLENKGNAQTNILFELQGFEASSSKWNPILPEVLILDSFGDPNQKTQDTATFSVATPFKNGWNNEEKAFTVLMKPSASKDATAGNVLTANVLARVRGIYVPALEPLAVLGAAMAVAVVVRSRRIE